jgi:GH18 family chitinase
MKKSHKNPFINIVSIAEHIYRSDLKTFGFCLVLLAMFSCGGGDDDPTTENVKPVVDNISPAAESIVKDAESITLKADATDADGTIAKVEFFIDDQLVGQATAAPYEFEWTPDASNHYILKVRATDDKGGSKDASISFTAVGFSCVEASTCTPYEAKTFSNAVVAFYPSWKVAQMPINTIAWSKLTHIIYSFALPVSEGEINTADIDGNINTLVQAAHANGVKVYLSIGGGGGSGPYIGISANARYRALFADRVKCYIKDHCLDGVDIDWEAWTGGANVIPAESNGLVDLLTDLRSTLDESTEISMDVYATNWNGKHYLDGAVQQVTYVNTMLYDLRGPWSEAGAHSAYNEVITEGNTIDTWGTGYWVGYRQWPKAKINIGMPFYGRDFDVSNGATVDYSAIVGRVQAAEGNLNADKIGNTYYDGPVTAGKKATYAKNNGYAGVMFWELTGDTMDDETSLLEAIDNALNE